MTYLDKQNSWLKTSASYFAYNDLDVQEIGIMDDGLQSLFVSTP